MNELSLFTGYGGFSLGLRLAGVDTKTVCYVEIDKYCQAVLEARIADGILDEAPIWGDIKTFDGTAWRGHVDILTGGFPCPPFSVAGLRKGVEDERNLWPETLRVVREVRPQLVFLENVSGILSGDVGRGIPSYASVIVGQLAEEGYRVRWEVLGADDIGAPHRRKRWWCIGVADSDNSRGRENIQPSELWTTGIEQSPSDSGLHRQGEDGEVQRGGWEVYPTTQVGDSNSKGLERIESWGSNSEGWQESNASFGIRSGAIPVWPPSPNDTDGWERVIRERPDLAPALSKEAESQFRGVDDGRSNRVQRLRMLGNGVVPGVVAAAWHLMMEYK
jgi:DNA (cytosine-5)-methyltransferase 1